MKKSLSLAEIIVLSVSFIVLVIAIITLTTVPSGKSFFVNKNDLVGIWVRDMSVSGTTLSGVKEVWRFGEDGSFMNTWDCEPGHYHSREYPKIMASGNYKASGSKITLNYSGVTEKLSYSLSNSKDELNIGNDAGGYKTFQRAY